MKAADSYQTNEPPRRGAGGGYQSGALQLSHALRRRDSREPENPREIKDVAADDVILQVASSLIEKALGP